MPGRTWAATSAMWIQTRAAVALAPRRDRVVEVARGGGVDGEGRQLGQVPAADPAVLGGIGGASGFDLDCGRKAPAPEPLRQQRLDSLAGVARPHFLPAPPPRTLPRPVVAPVPLAHQHRPSGAPYPRI